MKKWIDLTILVLFLSACASPAPTGGISTPIVSTVIPDRPPGEGPSPAPGEATPIPTLPYSSFSPAELKYRVLDQFPEFFYCDPDFYPVAREDEVTLALQRFPELQSNQEEFQAILDHNGLSGTASFTDEQKLLIYREHKKLSAIFFQVAGDRYQFQIQTGLEGQQGSVITGVIDSAGTIEIQKQEAGLPTCPICLAAGTLIDTPRGAVPVERLQLGDPVWTVNAAGERVSSVIVRLGNVRVPAAHQIVHIILSDGRHLEASPGHPTADGRPLSDLEAGDFLDGAYVIQIETTPYEGIATYDLLPSGGTGFYRANGILLGSTLAKP